VTSWRGTDLVRKSGQTNGRPIGAQYRSLPPVRLGGGGSARRIGSAGGPDLGPGRRRHRIRDALRATFGKGSALRQLDWILLSAVLALGLLGSLLVWAASSKYYLERQLIWIAVGLVIMCLVSMLDYRQIKMLSPYVLAASILGLLAVLTPLGRTVNGAKSWIDLPAGLQIEPSEYAKLAIILMSAMFLSEMRPGEDRPRLRAVAKTLAIAAIPLALVVKQPDLGVAVLLVALLVAMIALSGIRLRWLVLFTGAGAFAIYAGAKVHLLKAYQVSRLTSFVHPDQDPRGTGYSAYQAKILIGSGGLLGKGLFHGPLVAGNFVPEQHTDFIFAVAGEELGFAGCMLIIFLLGVVLFRALRIAAKADDQFGMLVAAGIAVWFGVQCFINIGMTIGLMPVTGLPLPFVSYGGSAIFADMIAIGILHTVHRHRSVFG
jgi:rod shape determining protein RodA